MANLLMMPILGMIAWEDLRDRAIRWWWLPLLAGLLMLGNAPYQPWPTTANNALWNLGFLAVQLSAAGLWLLARGRTPARVANSIGAGDLLFFVAVALGMPCQEFIPYHLSGLLMGLVLHLVWLRIRPQADPTIPLAGYMAIHLGFWLTLRPFIPVDHLPFHGH
ncbi:MAG: hypothetical protein JNL52_10860 [Flavobacteriales bacterium]|nr:hypothetical protein [Flavobacteriales bacterium]